MGLAIRKVSILGWESAANHEETEPHPTVQLLKPLFMDLMDEGTSYHKKKTLRDKIAQCLGLTA